MSAVLDLPAQEGWTPAPGWRCFHCDHTFETRQEAEDHFSLDSAELPACVQVLTEGQKAIVEDRRHWRNEALRLRDEVENLQYQVGERDYELRRFGTDVRTLSQAYLKFEEERNRRLAAEAKVRELIMRLQDAGVPWQPLEGESRSDWEILTEGGRLPVVDGCLNDPYTIYGYALNPVEAMEIADRYFADRVVRVELCDWQPGYAWIAVTENAA